MAVEHFLDGQWVDVSNATAEHVDSNFYQVTITGMPPWRGVAAFDAEPLRVAGKQSISVWGSKRLGDALILDVTVRK